MGALQWLEFANGWNLQIFGTRPASGTERKRSGRRTPSCFGFTTADMARQRVPGRAAANAWPRVARA
jgi:hypothetical protein